MLRDTPRTRLVLGILLVAAIVLVVVDSRRNGNAVLDSARDAGAAVFAPLAGAVSEVADPVSDAWSIAVGAARAQQRIDELEAENVRLTRQAQAADRDADRQEELADLLHLSGLGGYEIVAAQAVTRVTPQGYADTITLDAGSRDGITPDMTVVNGDGLVGRVTEVSENTATVLLITDADSAVGARLEGSEELGVVNGTSGSITEEQPLRFELLDASADIDEGARLVSLGSLEGAPFVPGVPIGTVRSVTRTPGGLSQTAEVHPFVDISRLDVVGVVVAGPEEDPRDSVLPPKPEEES